MRSCHGQSFGKLLVFFEELFWVGVFERVSDGKISVCMVTFGAEPKDYEIYDFVLKNIINCNLVQLWQLM